MIHFNDPAYRNDSEQCCGVETFPGQKCTDRVSVVTCPDCLAKMAELNVIESEVGIRQRTYRKVIVYTSKISGNKLYRSKYGFLIFDKADKFVERISNMKLPKAMKIVDNLTHHINKLALNPQ